MRLGIDAREACAARPRGTGKALAALLRHLPRRAPEWSITLYANRAPAEPFPSPAIVKVIDAPGDRFNVWERWRLPMAAFTDRQRLLHAPSQTAPPWVTCPVVLTVHDLIPLRIGDGFSREHVARFARALERSARKARRIIVVSEFTRADLLAAFPDLEPKVDVIHWGVSRPARPSNDAVQARCHALGLDRPYFVAFGGGAPRKNVRGILQALACFIKDATSDVKLVLIGVPGTSRASFMALGEELGIAKHVTHLDYVSDDAVAELLSACESLLYPSLSEGFGLPILEAMALGTPVVTSNVTSMPEIAGDAAILVDPANPGAIADAMRMCYLDGSRKDALRERGLQRVERFTWEATVDKTLATYRRALG